MRHFTPELQKLVQHLKKVMIQQEGIGIAAPQMGVLRRVIVLWLEEEPKAFINPRLTAWEGKEIGQEGCLSFPGYLAEVERFARIKVEAKDEHGNALFVEVSGLESRAFQHEIDHLDGILINERALPGSFRKATPQEQELLAAIG